MNAFPHSSTTDPLPSTAAPTVAIDVQAPFAFGVSARGGTWHDQASAIVETLRDLRAAGLVGTDARTDGEAA